jgi:hypothetical protein
MPYLPHALYIHRPSHTPWFDNFSNIWWTVQMMELLIMQFSTVSYHLFLWNPDILLSTLFLCTLNRFNLRSSQRDRSSFTPMRNNRQHESIVYSRASLIRTNWDSGMFGLVNFRINRVLQNTRPREGGGIGDSSALSSEGHTQGRLTM